MDNNDINTVPAIIYIPDNTYKLTVNAKLVDKNDEFYDAEMVLSLPEIQEARIRGEEWEDENTYWTLTEKAREELKNG